MLILALCVSLSSFYFGWLVSVSTCVQCYVVLHAVVLHVIISLLGNLEPSLISRITVFVDCLCRQKLKRSFWRQKQCWISIRKSYIKYSALDSVCKTWKLHEPRPRLIEQIAQRVNLVLYILYKITSLICLSFRAFREYFKTFLMPKTTSLDLSCNSVVDV